MMPYDRAPGTHRPAREAGIMRKNDPCIAVCRFDGRTGWCVGCGRTIPEIRAWMKLTPFRRTALLRELPARVRKVQDAPQPD